MHTLTHGILQDPTARDKFYFSPARVWKAVEQVLADPTVPAHDRPAIITGKLIAQAVAAEERCRTLTARP